jgi:methyl-accepting chemotaxis protein
MLQKLKSIVRSKEEFEKVNEQFIYMREELTLLKKEMSDFSKEINNMNNELKSNLQEINKTSESHISNLVSSIKEFQDLKQDLRKELEDFKLQKTRILQKLVESSDNEVRDSLERLKTDINRFNELKKSVDTINANIANAMQEINKFKTISTKIKAEDYELTNFAKEIFKADQEKLKLMKEIDSLKHLISRERRSRR